MTASVKPLRPKFTRSRLKVVTIVTTPKSAAVSRRARTIVEINWRPMPMLPEKIVTPAPRIASWRIAASGRQNVPFESKGLKKTPVPDRSRCDCQAQRRRERHPFRKGWWDPLGIRRPEFLRRLLPGEEKPKLN